MMLKKKVLLLIIDSLTVEKLKEWLFHNYEVIIPDTPQKALTLEFDIAIIDRFYESEITSEIIEKKQSISPKLLPFLVIYSDHNSEELILKGDEYDYISLENLTAQILLKKIDFLLKFCELSLAVTMQQKTITHLENTIEQVNYELDQFVYITSHDLQSPLNSIEGFSRLLYENYYSTLDQLGQRYLDHIVKGSNQIKTLLESLLIYSRIKIKPSELDEINCNQMIRQLLDSLFPLISEKKVRIDYYNLPIIEANPWHILQLFKHLITNSIKFCPVDRTPQLTLSATQENGYHIFKIEDNGIGIKEQDFVRIFNIFQRLHTSEDYPGIGFGLALCKKIINCYHGNIWLTSTVNEGTSFYFSFPISSPKNSLIVK